MSTLSDGQRRLYAGDFNHMSQEWQMDGSVIVTLHRTGDATAVRMHVSNLYGDAESVTREDVLDVGPSATVSGRQGQAHAGRG